MIDYKELLKCYMKVVFEEVGHSFLLVALEKKMNSQQISALYNIQKEILEDSKRPLSDIPQHII